MHALVYKISSTAGSLLGMYIISYKLSGVAMELLCPSKIVHCIAEVSKVTALLGNFDTP